MNETDLYQFLEKRFVATFLDELMPGIFHNFANPLNGIMGRAKLMQRRLEDFVRRLENRYPEIAQENGADCKKLISDIHAINNESDKFFDLFRFATGKFYALGARDVESLNLSALLEAELGFADFYLEFKHNVKKEIHLDQGVPSISGITAHYSVAFWMLIHEAAKNAQNQSERAFQLITTSEDPWVVVKISHIGASMVRGAQEIFAAVGEEREPTSGGTEGEQNVIGALSLFRQAGEVEFTHDGEADLLTIRIRYPR